MKLIEKMEAEVAGKVSVILDEAKSKAAEIEGGATAAIESLEKDARLATDKRLALEKAKRMAKITQTYKQKEAELKQELVDKVFDAARKELDSLPGSGDYDALFGRLASEAFEDLSVPVTVSVREGDRKLAEAAVEKAGVEANVDEDLRGQGGGLTLRSESGDVFIDNSLYTRLDRSRIEGVMAAGRVLFGGEAPAKSEAKPKKKKAKKKKAKKANDEDKD